MPVTRRSTRQRTGVKPQLPREFGTNSASDGDESPLLEVEEEKEDENHLPVVEEERDYLRPVEKHGNHVPPVDGDGNHMPLAEDEVKHLPVAAADGNHLPPAEEDRNQPPAVEADGNHPPAVEAAGNHLPVAEDEGANPLPVVEDSGNNLPVVEEDRNHLPVVEEDRNHLPVAQEEEEENQLRRAEGEEEHHLPVAEEVVEPAVPPVEERVEPAVPLVEQEVKKPQPFKRQRIKGVRSRRGRKARKPPSPDEPDGENSSSAEGEEPDYPTPLGEYDPDHSSSFLEEEVKDSSPLLDEQTDDSPLQEDTQLLGPEKERMQKYHEKLESLLKIIQEQVDTRIRMKDRPISECVDRSHNRSAVNLSLILSGILVILVYSSSPAVESSSRPPFVKMTAFNTRTFSYLYGQRSQSSEYPCGDFDMYSWYPSTEKLRRAIRETWGKDIKKNNDSAIVFLLGNDPVWEHMVRSEAETNGDILQYNIDERYNSLPKISVAMLMWAAENMDQNAFLVKTVDSISLNVYNLLRTVETLHAVTKTFIAGKLLMNEVPDRNPRNKNFVRRGDYVENDYPPYMDGCLYVITANLVSKMLQNARNTQFTTMEDVYITGILAYKMKAQRIGLKGIITTETGTPCDMHNNIARNLATAESIFEDHLVIKATIRQCRWLLWLRVCSCYPSVSHMVLD